MSNTLNPLAQNVVKSFNYLLKERSLSPADGKALASLMHDMASHYENRAIKASGETSMLDVYSAAETEERVRALLTGLGIYTKIE